MASGNQEVKLKNNSIVRAFLLTTQPAREGKIFIGSKQTKSYVIVDGYWRPIVDLLSGDNNVTQIADKLTQIDPKYFERKNVLDQTKIMIISLIQNKLIEKIDRNTLLSLNQERKQRKSFVDEDLIVFMTSNISFLVFLSLALFAILALFIMPGSFPSPTDYFWSKYLSLSIVTSFAFTWIGIYLHEGAHLLIAKSYGISGKLRLSHRLNFLVVETYFPDIYSVPKNGRIAIYISGIIIDLATIALFYVAISFISIKFAGFQIVISILKQFILLQWLSILWQFFFYMKTDFYFVIKELVGIENLYTFAKERLFGLLKFKWINLPVTKRENLIVNIYMVFFLIGNILGIARYVFYHIPILGMGILASVKEISGGAKGLNIIPFTDGLMFITVELFFTALLIYSIIRERRKPKIGV